jgi:hypothetical protein
MARDIVPTFSARRQSISFGFHVLLLLALINCALIPLADHTIASGYPRPDAGSFAESITLPPQLLTQPGLTRALALESVTFRVEPFAPLSLAFAADNRTRIVFFAANIDLLPGEDVSAITADAEDATRRSYALSVEYAARIPECKSISYVIVRLPDDLGDVGDVLVRMNLHGLASNRVRIGIGYVGGGPPDDPPSTPTPTPTPTPVVASVTMNPSSLSLTTGASARIVATAYDGSGNLIPNVTFTWQSRNVSVASVDQTGLVTGGASGSTTIVALAPNGVQHPATVTVAGSPTSTPTPSPTPTPTGPTFYVSSTMGAPGNSGTISSPWDLQTALNQPSAVVPGTTIYLRGGTYSGKFTSSLAGMPANPITVRSYPGEWAKIDGYVTTTLSSNIDASQTTITVADASKLPVALTITFQDQPGDAAGEQAQIGDKNGNVLTLNRGWNGTTAKPHSAGTTIILGGDQLRITGSDTIYRDFEVMSSDPVRSWGSLIQGADAPHSRGTGVSQLGDARNKLVNLIIHDNGGGLGAWPSSKDSEAYGCLIYNNGYIDGNGVAGHGWYIQNNPGSIKTYRDDITFNNQFFGFQEESVTGNTVNIVNDGLVVFNNPILIGAGDGIADNITFTNGFGYFRYGTFKDGLRLGYQGSNGAITVTGNYLAENGNAALTMKSWATATVTGNTFVTKGSPINTMAALVTGAGNSTIWNQNRYYDISNIVPNCLPGPDSRAVFSYNNIGGRCSNPTFAEWRSNSGFDAAAADLGMTAPSDPNGFFYSQTVAPQAVFIRPNLYTVGRANIIIYNWPLSSTVSVNLSAAGLTNGQAFEIRDAQNYFAAPVVQGTYNSSSPSVSIPMTGLTAAQPVGSSFAARVHTAPEFGVFVLIKTSN